MQSITTNYRPDLIEAIERARLRRERANPGIEVTTSDTIRALLMKALGAEEEAEFQPELPLNKAARNQSLKPSENKTNKS